MLLSSYKYSHRERGVVLVITLVVLVAMTLAAIALARSIDTTNIVAGNLAFRHTATLSADAGIEDAVNRLLPSLVGQTNCGITSVCPQGYNSWRQPMQEPPYSTWDTYWAGVEGNAITLAADPKTGNTVSYFVEAMCNKNGQKECIQSPPMVNGCNGACLNAQCTCGSTQRDYYRVTVRVSGPRNTVSFTQAIIAM